MVTEEHLIILGLNERQIIAIKFVKEKGKIKNADPPTGGQAHEPLKK
jgi:hypothetical protein